MVAHPFATHAFQLVVMIGPKKALTRSLTITVDTAGCGTNAQAGVVNAIKTRASAYVEAQRQVSAHKLEFRENGGPIVAIADNAASLQMHLRQYTGGSDPDLNVDIDVRFSLAVTPEGQLIEMFSKLDVEIAPNPLTWLIPMPWKTIELAIRIGNARTQVQNDLQKALSEGLRAYLAIVPPNMHLTTVRLTPDEHGTIIFGYCPIPSGLRFIRPVTITTRALAP